MMIKNEEFGFCLFDLPYIRENRQAIINDSIVAINKFKSLKPVEGNNITWHYKDYNIFSLANGSKHYYQIYKGLSGCIARYFEEFQLNKPEQLWMQSWVNFHKPGELLSVHGHHWKLHGYISIEPKKTHTVFVKDEKGEEELYAIQNEVGQVYLGPGYRLHYVKLLEQFDSERITLGFDLEMDKGSMNMGLIPVVL